MICFEVENALWYENTTKMSRRGEENENNNIRIVFRNSNFDFPVSDIWKLPNTFLTVHAVLPSLSINCNSKEIEMTVVNPTTTMTSHRLHHFRDIFLNKRRVYAFVSKKEHWEINWHILSKNKLLASLYYFAVVFRFINYCRCRRRGKKTY